MARPKKLPCGCTVRKVTKGEKPDYPGIDVILDSVETCKEHK